MESKGLTALSKEELEALWDESDKPNNQDRAGGHTKGEIRAVLVEKLKKEPELDDSTKSGLESGMLKKSNDS